MIATDRVTPRHRFILAANGRRQTCGHGAPHVLGPPLMRSREVLGGIRVVMLARCVACGRSFGAPPFLARPPRLETWQGKYLHGRRMQILTERAMAWMYHEAARP